MGVEERCRLSGMIRVRLVKRNWVLGQLGILSGSEQFFFEKEANSFSELGIAMLHPTQGLTCTMAVTWRRRRPAWQRLSLPSTGEPCVPGIFIIFHVLLKYHIKKKSKKNKHPDTNPPTDPKKVELDLGGGAVRGEAGREKWCLPKVPKDVM